MIGPVRLYTSKRKPWTLLERVAVACLIAPIVFVVALVYSVRVQANAPSSPELSFDALFLGTAIVWVVAFLLTFTNQYEK
jgi:hypothetical protein